MRWSRDWLWNGLWWRWRRERAGDSMGCEKAGLSLSLFPLLWLCEKRFRSSPDLHRLYELLLHLEGSDNCLIISLNNTDSNFKPWMAYKSASDPRSAIYHQHGSTANTLLSACIRGNWANNSNSLEKTLWDHNMMQTLKHRNIFKVAIK